MRKNGATQARGLRERGPVLTRCSRFGGRCFFSFRAAVLFIQTETKNRQQEQRPQTSSRGKRKEQGAQAQKTRDGREGPLGTPHAPWAAAREVGSGLGGGRTAAPGRGPRPSFHGLLVMGMKDLAEKRAAVGQPTRPDPADLPEQGGCQDPKQPGK